MSQAIDSKEISASSPIVRLPPAPNDWKAFHTVSKKRIRLANKALNPVAAARRRAYLDSFECLKDSNRRRLRELLLNREETEETLQTRDGAGLDIPR